MGRGGRSRVGMCPDSANGPGPSWAGPSITEGPKRPAISRSESESLRGTGDCQGQSRPGRRHPACQTVTVTPLSRFPQRNFKLNAPLSKPAAAAAAAAARRVPQLLQRGPRRPGAARPCHAAMGPPQHRRAHSADPRERPEPRPMGMCTMHPAMNSDGTHVYLGRAEADVPGCPLY